MKLPSILCPEPNSVWMPSSSLPEIRLRSAGAVPPTRLLVPDPTMYTPIPTPALEFGRATVPEGSVPMKLPATVLLPLA